MPRIDASSPRPSDDDGVWRESEWRSAAILGQGWVHGIGYAYGRAPDRSEIDLVVHGHPQPVPVNEAGWWRHLADTESGSPPRLA